MTEPLWTPTAERIEKARITELMRREAARGVTARTLPVVDR